MKNSVSAEMDYAKSCCNVGGDWLEYLQKQNMRLAQPDEVSVLQAH